MDSPPSGAAGHTPNSLSRGPSRPQASKPQTSNFKHRRLRPYHSRCAPTYPLAAFAIWVVDADGAINLCTVFARPDRDRRTRARSRGHTAYPIVDEAELRRSVDLYDIGYDGGVTAGIRHWHAVLCTSGLAAHNGSRAHPDGAVQEVSRGLPRWEAQRRGTFSLPYTSCTADVLYSG